MGPAPSLQWTCPAALGAKHCCCKLFAGCLGPFPQHASGERSHCINLRGFSSPTINRDHLSCQCLAALGRPPFARPTFFPASAVPLGRHLRWPRKAWRGCPPPGAPGPLSLPLGRTPSSAGTSAASECLLPDGPVDLQLGSPAPALFGGQAGDTREPRLGASCGAAPAGCLGVRTPGWWGLG